MSKEILEKVVGKAVTDEAFRKLLLSDPDKALVDFDLSDDEKETLRNMNVEEMGEVERGLDQRVTKASKIHL